MSSFSSQHAGEDDISVALQRILKFCSSFQCGPLELPVIHDEDVADDDEIQSQCDKWRPR